MMLDYKVYVALSSDLLCAQLVEAFMAAPKLTVQTRSVGAARVYA